MLSSIFIFIFITFLCQTGKTETLLEGNKPPIAPATLMVSSMKSLVIKLLNYNGSKILDNAKSSQEEPTTPSFLILEDLFSVSGKISSRDQTPSNVIHQPKKCSKKDWCFWNTKLMGFLKEKLTSQLKIVKEDKDSLITLVSLTKNKTRLCNWRKKSKIYNKDSGEPQKDNLSSNKKF